MSYPVKANHNEYLMERYSTRTKRKTLCSKYLQTCEKIATKKSPIFNNKKCQTLREKKSSDQSDLNFKQILSGIHEQLKQDRRSTETEEDGKSQSSIEYDYLNPLSVPLTPNLPQKRITIATVCLQDDQWRQLEFFVKHFPTRISLSNNLTVNSSTTHLLIDDSLAPYQCVFSKKIFQAVSRHLFIVSTRWIEQCLIENQILDETPYEIHGNSTMSTMHLARQSPLNPLFSSSISFAIDCHSFQRALTRADLAELVLLSGATLFDHQQQNPSSEVLIVLADSTTNRSQLQMKYKIFHRNIKYLTPGYLLKSIIYQKQQPFEDFEL